MIIWNNSFTPVFIAASFKIAKIGKQPKYSSVDAMRYYSVQFSSVAQSCLTLCDPMNHSTPGLSSPPPKKISCHLDNTHDQKGILLMKEIRQRKKNIE